MKYDHRSLSIFLSAAEAVTEGILGENGVAGAATHARADRQSRPNEGALRLRRHSRFEWRLTAPCRFTCYLAAAAALARSIKSSRTEPAAPQKAAATFGANGAGAGGRPHGTVQQRVEHNAMVSGLQVHMRCGGSRAVAASVSWLAARSRVGHGRRTHRSRMKCWCLWSRAP